MAIKRNYESMAREVRQLMGDGKSFKKARNRIIEKKRLKALEVKLLDKAIDELNLRNAKRYLVGYAFGS